MAKAPLYSAQKYAEDSPKKTSAFADENELDSPSSEAEFGGGQGHQELGESTSSRYRQLAAVGELISSSEDEDSRASIGGYERSSQQASDPVEAASTSEEIDVWANLEQIFTDMDAQEDADENKLLLREPLTRLRRLLAIHTDVADREKALRKCHVGVLVERDWYLGKLREIEGMVEAGSGKATTEAADVAFSGAVRNILYDESKIFRLAGSRRRG